MKTKEMIGVHNLQQDKRWWKKYRAVKKMDHDINHSLEEIKKKELFVHQLGEIAMGILVLVGALARIASLSFPWY